MSATNCGKSIATSLKTNVGDAFALTAMGGDFTASMQQQDFVFAVDSQHEDLGAQHGMSQPRHEHGMIADAMPEIELSSKFALSRIQIMVFRRRGMA